MIMVDAGLEVRQINLQRKKKFHQKAQLHSFQRICLEVLLFSCLMLTIPLAILLTEILFMFGTQHIRPDILNTLWEDNHNISAGGRWGTVG